MGEQKQCIVHGTGKTYVLHKFSHRILIFCSSCFLHMSRHFGPHTIEVEFNIYIWIVYIWCIYIYIFVCIYKGIHTYIHISRERDGCVFNEFKWTRALYFWQRLVLKNYNFYHSIHISNKYYTSNVWNQKIINPYFLNDTLIACSLLFIAAQTLQTMLDVTNHVALKYHLQFGAAKCKAIGKGKGRKSNLKLNGEVLEEVTTYKYLGEIINPQRQPNRPH